MNGIAYYINDANLQLKVFREKLQLPARATRPLQWIMAPIYRFRVIHALR
jgi:hypothetical protein